MIQGCFLVTRSIKGSFLTKRSPWLLSHPITQINTLQNEGGIPLKQLVLTKPQTFSQVKQEKHQPEDFSHENRRLRSSLKFYYSKNIISSFFSFLFKRNICFCNLTSKISLSSSCFCGFCFNPFNPQITYHWVLFCTGENEM